MSHDFIHSAPSSASLTALAAIVFTAALGTQLGVAHATEDPSEVTDGVYVGHRVGPDAADNKVTVELRGTSFVVLDRGAVGIGRIDEWSLAGPGTKSGGLTFKAVATALSRTSRAGKAEAVRAGSKSSVRLYLAPESDEAMLCATAPGSKTPAPKKVPSRGATTNPEPGVVCFELTRVWRAGADRLKVPEMACMKACMQRSQMKAVAIGVIEDDCRAECTR